MLEATGRHTITKYKQKSNGKEYEKVNFLIRIPSRVAQDSMYPFKGNCEVRIKVEGRKLIIEGIK